MVMGDLVLLDQEVSGVMSGLFAGGLEPREEASQEDHWFWPAEIVLEVDGRRHALHARSHRARPAIRSRGMTRARSFGATPRSSSPPSAPRPSIDTVGRLEKVADMADVARLVGRAERLG